MVFGYSQSLIEYSWSFVSLTPKRRIKSSSFPFFYLGVLAIVLLIVGDYSLSLIECLCSYVSLI